MCTVVFVPGTNKYYFASLRDEDPKRAKAVTPTLQSNNEVMYLSPVDPVGGGTWIGVNEMGHVIILLNGGFEKHQVGGPYLKSRGVIVKELLGVAMPVVDWMLMDMENIEPYTLIVWADNNLFQLVWDGTEKHRIRLAMDTPYLWSSSTLYNNKIKTYRKELFENWMATTPAISKTSVLDFFNTVADNENGFIINRNERIKTLSYSFVELTDNEAAVMNYLDLQSLTDKTVAIALKKNAPACLF
ncbi:NRDE family protein [Ferruginibacter sp.]|nr:NRDE family protein [Ferruginibacter sp.]